MAGEVQEIRRIPANELLCVIFDVYIKTFSGIVAMFPGLSAQFVVFPPGLTLRATQPVSSNFLINRFSVRFANEKRQSRHLQSVIGIDNLFLWKIVTKTGGNPMQSFNLFFKHIYFNYLRASMFFIMGYYRKFNLRWANNTKL